MAIKNKIQSSNLNFIFGSGLSAPFLSVLGEIEDRLTELLSREDVATQTKKVISSFLKRAYFERCIKGNLLALNSESDAHAVLAAYGRFFNCLHEILINRRSTVLSKQVNLFTTNMDILSELSLESSGIDYNDGFLGSLRPQYGSSNYRKAVFKTSQQYAVLTEVPVFNLYKIHGSVSWKLGRDEKLELDRELIGLCMLSEITSTPDLFVDVFREDEGKAYCRSLDDLITDAKDREHCERLKKFDVLYEQLVMVSPTKDKFRLTTLNQTYYDLLRIYANELERENSLLFVMGFSFADEHIAEVTLRAARTNPTLQICVFAYDGASEISIRKNLERGRRGPLPSNVTFVPREKLVSESDPEERERDRAFDLETITDVVFEKVARQTRGRG